MALSSTSTPSSLPRRAAAVSVVTNGLPVPVARIDDAAAVEVGRARRRMNGSATSSMRIVVRSRVSQPSPLESVLQSQAVDHRGRHAHVVGGGFLDHVGAAA